MFHLHTACITALPACFAPSPTCFTASTKLPPSLSQVVICLKHISKGWRAFGDPGAFLVSSSPLPLEIVHGLSCESNRVLIIKRKCSFNILAEVPTILLILPSFLKTVFFKLTPPWPSLSPRPFHSLCLYNKGMLQHACSGDLAKGSNLSVMGILAQNLVAIIFT